MLMGQRLCKELALVVAAWPAACHGLAGATANDHGRICKFLSLCEKNLHNSQVLVMLWEKLADWGGRWING